MSEGIRFIVWGDGYDWLFRLAIVILGVVIDDILRFFRLGFFRYWWAAVILLNF